MSFGLTGEFGDLVASPSGGDESPVSMEVPVLWLLGESGGVRLSIDSALEWLGSSVMLWPLANGLDVKDSARLVTGLSLNESSEGRGIAPAPACASDEDECPSFDRACSEPENLRFLSESAGDGIRGEAGVMEKEEKWVL